MNRNMYVTQLNSINERHRNEQGGQFNFGIRNVTHSNMLWSDEIFILGKCYHRLEKDLF